MKVTVEKCATENCDNYAYEHGFCDRCWDELCALDDKELVDE